MCLLLHFDFISIYLLLPYYSLFIIIRLYNFRNSSPEKRSHAQPVAGIIFTNSEDNNANAFVVEKELRFFNFISRYFQRCFVVFANGTFTVKDRSKGLQVFIGRAVNIMFIQLFQ